MREQSPFYGYFRKVITEEKEASAKRKADGEGDKVDPNPLFCPWFMDMLLTEYLPYDPLWTVMVSKTPADEPRATNCVVKQWMCQVKNRIWVKKAKFRPLWAVRKLRTSLEGRIRQCTIERRKQQVRGKNRKRKQRKQDMTTLDTRWSTKSPKGKKLKYLVRKPKKSQRKATSIPSESNDTPSASESGDMAESALHGSKSQTKKLSDPTDRDKGEGPPKRSLINGQGNFKEYV